MYHCTAFVFSSSSSTHASNTELDYEWVLNTRAGVCKVRYHDWVFGGGCGGAGAGDVKELISEPTRILMPSQLSRAGRTSRKKDGAAEPGAGLRPE